MIETTLKALMLAGLEGDRSAHEALLGACAVRLRHYFGRRLAGRPEEVEDLVQEVLIAIHRRRESYDTSLAFTGWLHAIARYKLIDHFRRTGRRASIPLDEAPEAMVEDEGEQVRSRLDVEHLLATLPAKQAEAIRMTRIEGLSVRETAGASGQSESAVKVGVHRGLRRLRQTMKDLK